LQLVSLQDAVIVAWLLHMVLCASAKWVMRLSTIKHALVCTDTEVRMFLTRVDVSYATLFRR
jgi:hypothetical protein